LTLFRTAGSACSLGLINFEAGYCTVATSYGTKETGLKSNSKPVKKGSFAFRKNKWFGFEQSAI
jgi:hypothetical protein